MLKYDVEERIDPEELAVAVFLNSAQEKVDRERPVEGKDRESNGKQNLRPPRQQKQQ